MMHDFQLARGDICADSMGLRVRIENVDIYDDVHFSVIKSAIRVKRNRDKCPMWLSLIAF